MRGKVQRGVWWVWGARLELASLTLLQLDVATSFDLRNPAVVNGPGGLWNRHGLGSAPPGLCHSGKNPRPSPHPSTDKSCSQGVTP